MAGCFEALEHGVAEVDDVDWGSVGEVCGRGDRVVSGWVGLWVRWGFVVGKFETESEFRNVDVVVCVMGALFEFRGLLEFF